MKVFSIILIILAGCITDTVESVPENTKPLVSKNVYEDCIEILSVNQIRKDESETCSFYAPYEVIDSATLVCADGWRSSSCGCDGGRGCCSHHGGYGTCDIRYRSASSPYGDAPRPVGCHVGLYFPEMFVGFINTIDDRCGIDPDQDKCIEFDALYLARGVGEHLLNVPTPKKEFLLDRFKSYGRIRDYLGISHEKFPSKYDWTFQNECEEIVNDYRAINESR